MTTPAHIRVRFYRAVPTLIQCERMPHGILHDKGSPTPLSRFFLCTVSIITSLMGSSNLETALAMVRAIVPTITL